MVSLVVEVLTGKWGGVVTGTIFFALSFVPGWFANRRHARLVQARAGVDQRNISRTRIDGDNNWVVNRQTNTNIRYEDKRRVDIHHNSSTTGPAPWGVLVVAVVAAVVGAVIIATFGFTLIQLIVQATFGATLGVLVLQLVRSRSLSRIRWTAGAAAVCAGALMVASQWAPAARFHGRNLADVHKSLVGGDPVAEWTAMSGVDHWVASVALVSAALILNAAFVTLILSWRAFILGWHDEEHRGNLVAENPSYGLGLFSGIAATVLLVGSALIVSSGVVTPFVYQWSVHTTAAVGH
ncbi:hypothetical protein [Branchiibius sp. NY16-3462-2]|uniref:hypothetical protein n=1 Tax=Branchiibius sp. NY16-3462-2 TaxID=1807500 RepID=UPI0007956B87|nr:hypothetical protein [Branchiibius sp. NY16-3462-2]KYH45702.1 hypothetical protein AZH51_18535 [Branchiibius sp. NY16-3462-2]